MFLLICCGLCLVGVAAASDVDIGRSRNGQKTG